MEKLQGTEKQVKWANDIRAKIIEKMENAYGTGKKLRMCGFKKDDLKTAIENIENIDKAETFIKMRFDSASLLIERYRKIEIEKEIEEIRKNERIMKRVNKIKDGGKSESYVETTEALINNHLASLGGREAEAILKQLLSEK